MKYVGIDYSITCPVICTYPDNNTWNPKQVEWWVLQPLADKVTCSQVNSILCKGSWSSPEQRFENLLNLAHVALTDSDEYKILMENYSFGSKGQVFQIGEATGLFKNWMWKNDLEWDTIPPTSLKKYATGSGKAKKAQMLDAFVEQTGWNIREIWNNKRKFPKTVPSPISDMVDAYFLCKKCFESN